MHNAFPFKVGDKVTSADRGLGQGVTITAIGKQSFLAAYERDNVEYLYSIKRVNPWVKVVEYPERWSNIYPNFVGGPFRSRAAADIAQDCSRSDRIGVLHLFPDGHTVMESP